MTGCGFLDLSFRHRQVPVSQTCCPSFRFLVSRKIYTFPCHQRPNSQFVSVNNWIFTSCYTNSSTPAAGTSSNPVPSEPIGGTSSVVVDTITTSLAILKEGSAVASRIPYIGAIAGILLQAFVMQDVRPRLIYSPGHGFC